VIPVISRFFGFHLPRKTNTKVGSAKSLSPGELGSNYESAAPTHNPTEGKIEKFDTLMISKNNKTSQ